MTRRYADGTAVPVDRTRIEIEETLRRFSADSMVSGYEGARAFVMFRARGRFVRLVLDLPSAGEKRFTLTPTGKSRSPTSAAEEYEAEVRRRWRSLGLLVKAKLAAVADGIVEFEAEFLPHIVLPDNRTVADYARPAIERAYETGEPPKLLPNYGSP